MGAKLDKPSEMMDFSLSISELASCIFVDEKYCL
jgi:hypothetical protein